MHDLLEGVVKYELKLLVSSCCERKKFTLKEFKGHLVRFDSGYGEV